MVGDQDDDSTQDTDAQDNSATANDASNAVASAAPHEVDAHRNALGEMIQTLSDKGIDVQKLAEQAGVQSTDIDELSHGDLANLTAYIAQNHPEVLSSVASRFPAAQGLIGMFASGGALSGMLGGIFARKEQDS